MNAERQQTEDRRRHQRRREDRENGGGTSVSRHREVFRRLREPLIGLTLAGAAAPLITDAASMDAGEKTGGEADRLAGDEAALSAGVDVEESVNREWAYASATAARAQFIDGALVRYGIGQDLAEDIFDIAQQEGIEPDLAFGLVNAESTFRERAVSHVGARGLTQVMPRTARWLDPTISASDLFDRRTNLRLGFSYLNQLIEKYDGNVRNALLAYNRGPGTVDKILKRGGNPDNGYADKVLSG